MKKLLLTLRLFKNYRLYSIINTVGLALSLACVITISRYLYSELTVDTMHTKHRNIYGVLVQEMNSTALRQGACININKVENFTDITLDPAVLAKTNILRNSKETVTSNNLDYQTNVMVVDSSFTKVFDFTTTIGSLSEVEKSVDKVAITSETALKMFGNDNPLGKTVSIKNKTYTVSAIIAEPTSKTSMIFDMIVPGSNSMDWMLVEHQYFLMPDDFDYKTFNDKYPNYNKLYRNSLGTRYLITPIKDISFNKSIEHWQKEMTAISDRESLNVIFAVALLVLVIGVFNFINIYTVLMLRRSREVGVKKVFGASTASITSSIYLENMMMVTVSVTLGWLITVICKDFTASTLGIPVISNLQFDAYLTTAFLVILPLMTTIYPYLKYRYAKPITSLREVGGSGRSIISRATFLVLQYSITIIMVIISVYFVCQMKYILNADLGYKHNDIISVSLFANKESRVFKNKQEREEYDKRAQNIKNNYKIICDELAKSPIVQNFSCNDSPNTVPFSNNDFRMKLLPDGEFIDVAVFGCDKDFFSMYSIDKTAGRLWSDSTDHFTQYLCIVNETFLREFGIDDYSTVSVQTNKRIWFSVMNEQDWKLMEQNPPYTIVGVVRDFQVGHLKSKTPPLIIYYSSYNNTEIDPASNKLQVQAAPGKAAEVIKLLEELHGKFGNGEFSYTMIDDEIAMQYEQDRKVTNIYTTFAMIAIIIGSLGLFSLSLYDVQQRYREIALRRVNGATIIQILIMLLRKYYIMLCIAFIIAAPVAYFAIEWYMQDFANKVTLDWWIFAIAAVTTAAISILTLIYQTIKAATTNPAVAMKAE